MQPGIYYSGKIQGTPGCIFKNIPMAEQHILERLEALEKLIRQTSPGRYMTVTEVAAYVRMSRRNIDRRKKEIGYIQRDRAIIFDRQDVEKWLQKNKTK